MLLSLWSKITAQTQVGGRSGGSYKEATDGGKFSRRRNHLEHHTGYFEGQRPQSKHEPANIRAFRPPSGSPSNVGTYFRFRGT